MALPLANRRLYQGVYLKPPRGRKLAIGRDLSSGLLSYLPAWEGQGTPYDIAPANQSVAQPFSWVLSGAATWTTGQGGIGLRFNGSGSDRAQGPGTITVASGSSFTVMVVFSLVGVPGTDRALLLGLADSGGTGYQFDLGVNTSGNLIYTTFDGSTKTATSLGTVTAGPEVHVAIGRTVSGSAIQCFLDGVPSVPTSIGTANGGSGLSLYVSQLLSGAPNWSNRLNGIIWSGAAWMRGLSNTTIAELSAHPYRLFEPRHVGIPVGLPMRFRRVLEDGTSVRVLENGTDVRVIDSIGVVTPPPAATTKQRRGLAAIGRIGTRQAVG